MAEKPKISDDERRGPSIEIPGDLADFMDAGDLHYEDGVDLEFPEIDKYAPRVAPDPFEKPQK